MNRYLKIGLLSLCLILLVLIRFFQTDLFNDPFIEFYKSNHAQKPPPAIQEMSLYLATTFRYFLNTIISLVAIWILFPKRSVFQFSVAFYLTAFVVLMLAKVMLIKNLTPEWYSTLFYVRRFLIQPLFLFILLPAFYYQQQLHNNKA